MVKDLGIASAILFLVVGMLIALLFDAGFAVSWHHGFFLFALLPLLVALLAWRERVVQIAMLAYLAILFVIPLTALSPVKPFKRFFSRVEAGMVEADVMGELTRQFPEGGRFPRPVRSGYDDGSLCFQLDPNDGAYNAELVAIKMQDGRVVSKEYLPD